MNSIAKIFKDRLIQNYLSKFSKENILDFERKWKRIQNWRKSCIQGDLEHTKETQIQGAFLVQIFDEILGYSTVTSTDSDFFYQKQEFNSVLDASEADAGLGFFSVRQKVNDVRVVIELKDAKKDLDKKQNRSNHLTPVEQGFSYANKNGSKCGWVIVSNFIETRLYKSNSSLEYESFDIRKMDNEAEFLRFYFFLSKDNLIAENGKSFIDQLYQENEEIGASISKDFYKTYKEIRSNLYTSLKETNPDCDELLLFTKSQKIMDRFIFICFCEDCGLLPQHIFQRLIEATHNSFSFSQTKLWDELRGLFNAIDKGNPQMKINRYNGGLFKADPDLDKLIIYDDVLETFTSLSEYDFGSDLNVNILGQIFEQSIFDVEQIKNEINGIVTETKGKQKDDGIFYTPYYVTRYIVEQTVGVFLNQKKEELKHTLFSTGSFRTEVRRNSTNRNNVIEIHSWTEVPEEKLGMTEDEEMYRTAVSHLHLKYWTAYENVLKEIKICDPACGSGAFLNQCFDYLHEEMNFVLEMKRLYNEGQLTLFDIDREILQNNLFGVDINPESVEITKLSLWLKTAKQNQTLASLDDNIKCGNSIVTDPEIAGKYAFNWQAEFPQVFANGGFDIIIGNPPYGATLDQPTKKYLTEKYITTEYNFDTYKTFFELGFNLLRENGYLGYITPNTFFTMELGANKLRKFLFDNNTLLRIVEVYNVFPTAVVEPVITVFKKKNPLAEEFISICVPRKTKLTSTFLNDGIQSIFNQKDLKKDEQYIFNYRNSKEDQMICEKMQQFPRLDTLFDVMTGAKPYQVGKGTPPQTKEIVKEKPFTGFEKIDDTWKPYMRGRFIDRYSNLWASYGEYIKYGEWLAEPRSAQVFMGEKLFIRQTGDSLIATYDKGNVSNNTLHSIYPLKTNSSVSLYYLLGIINSKLLNWYYKIVNYLEVGKPMAEIKGIYIRKLPIAVVDRSIMGNVENYVKELLALCSTRYSARQEFLNFIINVYEPKKISEQLEHFYESSFIDFCKELKKQKVKLTASQQMELLPLFNERKKQLEQISIRISEVQLSLDDMIFSIYQIPKNVAEMIKQNIQIKL